VEAYAAQIITQDRGLGTAYERWCFYQRMDAWAREYGVESALEGPVDGVAGVRGVHCAGLAREGVRVVSAVPSAESADVARGVYADVAPTDAFDVRVVGDEDMTHDLPPSDLSTLAPALWELGRVREHVYFDAPWWPDLPVAPGQSLAHRLKQLVVGSGGARFAAPERGAILSSKYVYGPGRWPYFGGPAWLDELEPALLRHPAFEGSSPALVRRAAHLHAFVVDMRPRSPQARRRLAQSV